MKTIGLIGGMSWESTTTYYRLINEGVHKRLGGMHSARLLMHSFDFEDIAALQRQDDWNRCNEVLVEAGRGLKHAGAEVLLICTNTMHVAAAALADDTKLPVLHIADALGGAIRRQGLKRLGLLGTKFTMERPDVLRARLISDYDLTLLTPEGEDGEAVHRIIYDELVQGILREESRARYREVIAKLVTCGAEGIILGCTEIPLLVQVEDSSVPLFDTTALHAAAAVDYALE
jgi:aspartate racemase